ncbi:hypothetical protein N9L68_00310 [bacterium]|nr:hypothetical protein [bacterium]
MGRPEETTYINAIGRKGEWGAEWKGKCKGTWGDGKGGKDQGKSKGGQTDVAAATPGPQFTGCILCGCKHFACPKRMGASSGVGLRGRRDPLLPGLQDPSSLPASQRGHKRL